MFCLANQVRAALTRLKKRHSIKIGSSQEVNSTSIYKRFNLYIFVSMLLRPPEAYNVYCYKAGHVEILNHFSLPLKIGVLTRMSLL